MAEATTASYEELVLEVEWVADSGTYSPICGLTGASITRSQNVTSTEVPDCSDESVPYYVQRRVPFHRGYGFRHRRLGRSQRHRHEEMVL